MDKCTIINKVMKMKKLICEISNLFRQYSRHIILTLGNEFRGDDILAIEIGKYLSDMKYYKNKVINAYNVPINFLGKIVNKKPELIIIIDAIDLKLKPGKIVLIDQIAILEKKSTTHLQSINDFIELIKNEFDYMPKIYFLGIQIKSNDIFNNMSNEVLKSVNKIKILFYNIANEF